MSKTTEIFWSVPEYEKHNRSLIWYIVAIIFAISLLIYSFYTANFLFAIIVVMAGVIIYIHDGQEPEMVNISLGDEGIKVGGRFYYYDQFKNFSIIYKPKERIKGLYLEYKNTIKPRLNLPLDSVNPLQIREKLLKYVPEDLERDDEPFSDTISRLFKI